MYVEGKRVAGGGFGNDSETVRVVYDFDKDAGAVGVLDLLDIDKDCIVKSFHAVVKTAVTSGGAATLDVGVAGGDTDVMMAAKAVASLTLNSAHGEPAFANLPIFLAAGSKLQQEIKVAAFTAGKVEYVFEIMKA